MKHKLIVMLITIHIIVGVNVSVKTQFYILLMFRIDTGGRSRFEPSGTDRERLARRRVIQLYPKPSRSSSSVTMDERNKIKISAKQK